jgi:hypothetical protein
MQRWNGRQGKGATKKNDKQKKKEGIRRSSEKDIKKKKQGWKKPGFFKKNQPSGFLGFFGFYWVFFLGGGGFGFFCPDERVFRVFFSFTNTFRCIQTLNYNHSY